MGPFGIIPRRRQLGLALLLIYSRWTSAADCYGMPLIVDPLERPIVSSSKTFSFWAIQGMNSPRISMASIYLTGYTKDDQL
ncbi:hypothetical protein BDV25DRAFT_1032 [Aspergillus avenaceus]|uniref:Uncharacterized protein n=1 Tax=Aspergillus avenaceus TaxID=36643 RepID=A0A5N6U9S4_ASPAV|nr:hypothetical protein BDV25DRAFT_1032 [Aspergillus avenaceus]